MKKRLDLINGFPIRGIVSLTKYPCTDIFQFDLDNIQFLYNVSPKINSAVGVVKKIGDLVPLDTFELEVPCVVENKSFSVSSTFSGLRSVPE